MSGRGRKESRFRRRFERRRGRRGFQPWRRSRLSRANFNSTGKRQRSLRRRFGSDLQRRWGSDLQRRSRSDFRWGPWGRCNETRNRRGLCGLHGFHLLGLDFDGLNLDGFDLHRLGGLDLHRFRGFGLGGFGRTTADLASRHGGVG